MTSEIKPIDLAFPLVVTGENITLAEFSNAPEDVAALKQLKPELFDILDRRIEHYRRLPNRDQSGHFLSLLEGYRAMIDGEVETTSFLLLGARGRRIVSAFDTAKQEVEKSDSEWSPFEPSELADLGAFVDVHGLLMSHTISGRSVIERMHQQTQDIGTSADVDGPVKDLVETVTEDSGVFTAATSDVMHEVAKASETGPRAGQSLALKYAMVSSIGAVVLFGPAAIAAGVGYGVAGSLGLGVGGATGVAASASLRLLAREALKNSEVFIELRDDATTRINRTQGVANEALSSFPPRLEAAVNRLKRRAKPAFDRIASVVPEFRWLRGAPSDVTLPDIPDDEDEALDPDDLEEMVQRAIRLLKEGRAVEAEAVLRRTLPAMEGLKGAEHPDTLGIRFFLASALLDQGKAVEAETALRDLLSVRERVLGAEHPNTLTTRHDIARALLNQGKAAEAEAAWRDLLPVHERVSGAEHPHALATRHEIARALLAQGKVAEAEAAYRDLLPVQERVTGAEHPHTLVSRYRLAQAMLVQARAAEAAADLEALAPIAARVMAEIDPKLGHIAFIRAQCADALGDSAAADGFIAAAEANWGDRLTPEHFMRRELAAYLANRNKPSTS